MDKAQIIFESYNMAVENSYNLLFEAQRPEDLLKIKEEDVVPYLEAQIREWEDAPLDEIGGQTPREYFAALTGFDAAFEQFKQAAVLCDDKLPCLLLDCLRKHGDKAVDALVELAEDEALRQNEDNFLLSLAAIQTLGEWRVEKAVEPLVHILENSDEEEDAILEGIGGALTSIGVPAVDCIIAALEAAEEISYARENLVSALSFIGRNYKSEKVFKCLKQSFLTMDNKIIGAVCLADYGDGRAIPTLRGYAAKNLETIDAETFYQIKSAVETLGGNMDDLEPDFEFEDEEED